MNRGADVTLHLSVSDLHLLLEGLDAYEYWQLGDALPRNNGVVFIPGDLDPGSDPYWGSEREISPAEDEAIEAVVECRELASRLQRALKQVTRP